MDIAVVIPCYNCSVYIDKTIQALLNQTLSPAEILVIDDGSQDDSHNAINKYSVRLIKHERNRGLAHTRNTALQNTDCEIILYVDADAYADKYLIQRISDHYQDQDVCGVGGQGIEAIQQSIYDRWRFLHASQSHGNRMLDNCQHLFGLCMAYRRQALIDIGGFDTRLKTNAEDMDIGYRLFDAGKHLVYTPKAIVYHQRKDNYQSLRRMMYNWYHWAFIVKRNNQRNPWSLAYGTIRRMLFTDTLSDLIIRRDVQLAKLNINLSNVKLKALFDAAKL